MLHRLFLTEILPTLPNHWHIRTLYIGKHWTIVVCEDAWGEQFAGLSASPTAMQMAHLRTFDFGYNTVACQNPLQLANLFATHHPICNGIGLAILNALLAPKAALLPAAEPFGWLLEACWRRKTAVVGHAPVLPNLDTATKQIQYLPPDLNPLCLDNAPYLLAQADVVIVNSRTLLDATLDDLLLWVHPEAKVIMVDVVAPLTATLLNAGIDVVAGVVVGDILQAFTAVVSGKAFAQLPGTRHVALANELKQRAIWARGTDGSRRRK